MGDKWFFNHVTIGHKRILLCEKVGRLLEEESLEELLFEPNQISHEKEMCWSEHLEIQSEMLQLCVL